MKLTLLRLIVISFPVVVCPTAAAQQIFYVDDTATGTDAGTSWQNAFTDLQSALAVAAQADSVWVARGTYKPTTTLDRTATFSVDTSIYGGFDGTETTLESRAGLFDETILTGDLLGNDGPNFEGNQENSANVLSVLNLLFGYMVIDGFTVKGGNADIGLREGGGLYVAHFSSWLYVRNCTFAGNQASWAGGGVSCQVEAQVEFERCTFVGNRARLDGGGVAGGDNEFRSCTFLGNRAGRHGGGFYVAGPVVDCVFSGNTAGGKGGGAYFGYPIRNCTFSGNRAARGGGYAGGLPWASLLVLNSVLWGNEDETGGIQSGQIAGYLTVRESLVQGWDGSFAGAGSFDADPLFRSPLGADGIAGTLDDDLRLEAGSPCVDTGGAPGYDGLGVDALGLPRLVDSLGCDGRGVLDRGAIERQEVDGTTVFCASTPSSIGVPAEIGGPCTATPNGGTFTILARPIPDGRAFLLLGDPGAPLPFGDGKLCLSGRLRRTAAAIPTGGTVAFVVDPTLPPASDLLVPGATVGLQVLFRDAAAGGAGFNLSSAMWLLALP